jgi:hypothetical protein
MTAEREAYHAAGRLSRAARDLMQAPGDLDRPSDSYSILGNVLDAARSLEIVLGQLAEWHRSAKAGRHYDVGHDDSTIGVMTAVTELEAAAQHVDALQGAISRAYSGKAVVRWFDEVEPPDGP